MSDEKKAYVSAPYGSQEPKRAAADGGGSVQVTQSSGDNADEQTAGSAQRPRGSQTVLPDILGKQLRAAYGELLSTPVPDRINDLIKQLQRQEAATPPPSPSGEEDNS